MDIKVFRLVLIISAVVWLSACGTVSTVSKTNGDIRAALVKQDTRCSAISRVYSGVAYDFCVIHAEPNRSSIRLNNSDELLLAFYGVDMVVSALSDTLMLPYTIAQQKRQGNIEIQN